MHHKDYLEVGRMEGGGGASAQGGKQENKKQL